MDQAFESGEIVERDGLFLSSSTPLFHIEDLPELLNTAFLEIYCDMNYQDADVTSSESSEGSVLLLRKMEVLTGTYINYNATLMENTADPVTRMGNLISKILNGVRAVYSYTKWPVLVLLVVGLLGLFVLWIKAYRKKEAGASTMGMALILSVGILLTVFAQQIIVCWFSEYLRSFESFLSLFFAPSAIPLISIAMFILVGTVVDILLERFKGRQRR